MEKLMKTLRNVMKAGTMATYAHHLMVIIAITVILVACTIQLQVDIVGMGLLILLLKTAILHKTQKIAFVGQK